MKKLFSFIFLALLPVVASATVYDAYVNGIYYNLSENEAYVSYKEYDSYANQCVPAYRGNVVVPASITYNGKTYSVTRIGGHAFADCKDLKSVTIPESVTSIGYDAFANCSGLTAITIPSRVTYIGEYAFFNCSNLASITIPGSVRTMGVFAFCDCSSLATVTILDGISYIDESTFKSCSSLTTVNLPSSITRICTEAFKDCSSLASITIPESVTTIQNGAFRGCSALTSVTIPEGVSEIANQTFADCSALTTVAIPSTMTALNSCVFQNCSSLSDIYCYAENVPGTKGDTFDDTPIATAALHVPMASLTAYRSTAPWNGFGSVVSVDAPPSNIIYFADANVKALCVANWDTDSDGELSEAEAAVVTDLGEVFKGNTAITSFDELWYFTGLTSIRDEAFRECDGLTSVIIPENVTSIGSSAFSFSGLTTVTIPNSVTSIESNAFYGCASLTSASISSNVKSINSGVFGGCTALTSITLPEGIQEIGTGAFGSCNALTTVVIPSSVTSIGSYAFQACSSLATIQCYADNVPETEELAFESTPIASARLEVPAGSKDLYKTTLPWSGFENIWALTIKVNETTFPDMNFRRWLHDTSFGYDYRLKEEELIGVESIKIGNYGIKNLTGIEFFPDLKSLDCSHNKLTALDLSECPGLETVNCAFNNLASLNISKNTLLTSLDCSRNSPLTELDVSQNTALTSLECSYCALTMLDVSQNTALTSLSCRSNKMTMLDMSPNTNLTSLNCGANKSLTMLNVSQNAALKSLSCESSNLSELYLPKGTALTSLSCRNNKLTTLDVSGLSALPSLNCNNNALTSIDMSGCTALKSLDCSQNNMTTLNIIGNPGLTYINCSSNKLTSLDMSGWTALTSLNCGSNQLTALDVSKNTALTTLQCGSNQLTSLSLSNNTALYRLECNNNKLTRLDVSQCANLHALYCQRNQIKDAAMDALVESLPDLTGDLFVISTEEDWPREQNVITTTQVATANAKGWQTYSYVYAWDYDDLSRYTWEKYAGSRPNTVVAYTAGKMATIILPTAPDASKGWYYRLDRCEANRIIFEQELQPQARTPYVIVPKEDFTIDLGEFDLSGLSSDTVSVKGIHFIGSYISRVLPAFTVGEGGGYFYIDIIDVTPDCLIAEFGTGKSVVGALRGYLIVHWDDPYNPGGTKGPQEKMQIVLKDDPDGSLTPAPSPRRGEIYDLSGRKIVNSKLPRGIYIQNGRKFVK